MISFSASMSFIKAMTSQLDYYNCDFPPSHLRKFAWGKIQDNAPDVYYLLSKMHFDKDTLDSLLHKHKDGGGNLTSQEVSCDWVRRTRDVWMSWLPPGSLNKVPVYLGGMFPLSISEDVVWSRPGILQGKICFAMIKDKSGLTGSTGGLFVNSTCTCMSTLLLSGSS